MPSVIEDHPQLTEINNAILNRQSIDQITKWVSPPVSRATIQRYRARVLAPAIKQHAQTVSRHIVSAVKDAVPGIADEAIRHEIDRRTIAAPFIARVEQKFKRYEKWMDGAEQKEDYRALSALDTAETRAIQLQAQLSGALQSDASMVNQQIAIAIQLPALEPDHSSTAGEAVIDIQPTKR